LRFRCPLCGADLKELFAEGESHAVLVEKSVIGGGPRANVICPVCYSSDRERLVFLFLKNRPHLVARGKRLMHVAPEDNLRAWLKSRPGLDYVTADLCMKDVDFNVDLTKIPFADASYDGVICNHVLEHIPDDATAMSEILRILKPNGWAILQTPIAAKLDATYEDFSITDPQERERAFGQNDHVRIYAMDYVDRLRRAGFAVESFRWTADKENFGGEENRFGLIEKEIIFFATRPASSKGRPSASRP
jgi:SAM-dependent methyltransferase